MLVVRSVSVVTWMPAGRLASSCGRRLLDALDDADGVGAGLALDVQDDGGSVWFIQAAWRGVFDAVDDVGDIFEQDGRAVAVGDDDVADSRRWSASWSLASIW